ncbi:MAG: hypothetical protein GY698_04255 [Actinomycetia bacterium]|nr:hypothetical protein [Actinomycetes bacterium]
MIGWGGGLDDDQLDGGAGVDKLSGDSGEDSCTTPVEQGDQSSGCEFWV